jgi:hypothetical protein
MPKPRYDDRPIRTIEDQFPAFTFADKRPPAWISNPALTVSLAELRESDEWLARCREAREKRPIK